MRSLLSLPVAVAAALLFSLASASCVRTGADAENCEYPLRLKFSYTYNREGQDLLMEEVPTIKLRLFNTGDNSFVKGTDIEISDLNPDGTYSWRVPAGRFTLVSWGGVQQRYLLANSVDLNGHTLSLPAGGDGYVSHVCEHLWHNITTDILINGDVTPEYAIDLHKLSNDITVTVRSSDGRQLDNAVTSEVRVANGLYHYSGIISPDAVELSYTPGTETGVSQSEAIHRYTTLGIARDDNSTLSVSYGGSPIYNGGLTELIARQPDIIFDLDDDFRLDFEVNNTGAGNASVSVAVNNWHITDYNVTLK